MGDQDLDIIQEIALDTGMSEVDLNRIICSAPLRYKQYTIPKKSGGTRTIAQPSRELKKIQTFLVKKKLCFFPIHRCATAYVKGRNILDNAEIHRRSTAILKLDFENFFPSIRVKDWKTYVKDNNPEWEKDNTLTIMNNVLFWGQGKRKPKCLSIGAPSSPFVSNLIMFKLDCIFDGLAQEQDIAYSRYADDITVSGDSISKLIDLEKKMQKILRDTTVPKLKFNASKRGLYTRGQRRLVTGLIITPEGSISLGRQRKRIISSMLHKFSLGILSDEDVGYLKGMLGFSISCESDFVGRLHAKYGDTIVDSLLETRIPNRRSISSD